MTTVNHSVASGVHPAALIASSDPGAPAGGVGVLWIDPSAGPPYQIWKRNAANTGWDQVAYGPANTGEIVAGDFKATGLTGAANQARLVGRTASAAPASGTFSTGDFIVTTGGSLYICTAGGTPGTWANVASGGSITTAQAALGADVTMTSLDTGYDGPSISLAAGTWLIWGAAHFNATSAANFTAKIWDGTTGVASGEAAASTSFSTGGVSVAIAPTQVTPGTTTTYKITALAHGGTGTNKIKAATSDNGAGNNATQIVAIKVA